MGIFSSDEEKYYNKAHSYFNKGDFEKAIEYLDKVLEINPLFINALNNKGVALRNMGMFDEALNYYNKVLEIEPGHVMTVSNMANILMDDIKNYKEALKYYNILLKMDKEVFMEGFGYPDVEYSDILLDIWNEKGLALFNLRKYEEAVSCYDETLKIDAENLKALNGKKLAENELNNIQNGSGQGHPQISNGMNFCPKCGTKSIAGAEFCYKCGARLTQTNVVGNINTSVNGSEKNFNYQNREYTEKPLVNRKPRKGLKRSFTSISATISNFSLIFFYASIVGIIISFIIAFIDPQLFYIIIPFAVYSLCLSLALMVILFIIFSLSDALGKKL